MVWERSFWTSWEDSAGSVFLKSLKTFPITVFEPMVKSPQQINAASGPWLMTPPLSVPLSLNSVFLSQARYVEAGGSGDSCTLSEYIYTHLGSSLTRSLNWPINIDAVSTECLWCPTAQLSRL